MSRQTGSIVGGGIAAMVLLLFATVAAAYFDLPPLPRPEEYGNLIIDRLSSSKGVKPVAFSHWRHRSIYTCRVCHSELDFAMKVNTTEMTEANNRRGQYCGACHNGKTAFRHEGNCERCHTGEVGTGVEKFVLFEAFDFPRTSFGNQIDWVDALKRRLIVPNRYLKTRSQDIPFDKKLLLEAEWNMIPPAVFPHRPHTAWLDCNNCHPEIFTIKRKGTKHFAMSRILKGEFCGVCHLTVAFPMDDCKRCHPD